MARKVDTEGKLVTLQIIGSTSRSDRRRYPLKHFPFYFHVPPKDTIRFNQGANRSKKKIIGKGSVSSYGGPELRSVSWDGFFIKKAWHRNIGIAGPHGTSLDEYPSYVMQPPSTAYNFYGANESIFILRRLMEDGTVVGLTMIDQNTGEIDVKYAAVITSFEYEEEGGEPDTRYYSITFEEYKYLRIRKVPRAGKVPGSGGRRRKSDGRFVASPLKIPSDGIGIRQVARKAYHDSSKWRIIRDANGGDDGMRRLGAKKRLGNKNGPYLFKKGTKLRIPPITRKR